MGLFSSNCNGCGHPLLSPQATNGINSWMQNAVVITPNGSILKGTYDGYGRVDGNGEDQFGESTVWHDACWKHAGSPTEFTGASMSSDDQGWFFEDPDHDLHEPR